MKYYYLDGPDKLGPFSQSEISKLNLPINTLILRDDKSNWLPKSDYKELDTFILNEDLNSTKIEGTNFGVNIIKYIIVTIGVIVVLGFSFGIYKRFTLDEESAKEISLKFFNMLTVKNNSTEDFEKIYPEFALIGTRPVLNNICDINSISKNTEGEIEIYASYKPNKVSNFPIYLLITKENGVVIIKSSKGINYAYFDNVLNYGKKKGCLTGNEDDAKMGLIIKDKNLKDELETEGQIQIQNLYRSIKRTSNLEKNYGYVSGDVTISNESNIFLSNYDFTCRIEFYDANGQITESQKLYFWEGVPQQGSTSTNVMTTSENSTSFKIIFNLNDSEDLKNKIKDEVIAKTNFGCF